MKNVLNSLALIVLFLSASAFTNIQQPSAPSVGKWIKLGSKKVNYGLDKDVIHVGIKEGGFRKLKLKVTKGGLNLHNMTVHYGNGQSEKISVRHNFGRKGGSRVIDLNGGKRVIEKIVFWYDTKNFSGRKAKLTVYGKH